MLPEHCLSAREAASGTASGPLAVLSGHSELAPGDHPPVHTYRYTERAETGSLDLTAIPKLYFPTELCAVLQPAHCMQGQRSD